MDLFIHKKFILGEISITTDADDTTVMAECKEELKSLLMKVKEESEKVGLKLNKELGKELDMTEELTEPN